MAEEESSGNRMAEESEEQDAEAEVSVPDVSISRQVSGTFPTSPDGTMEDVGVVSASAAASAMPALPEDGDLPNDLPVAEVQKEEEERKRAPEGLVWVSMHNSKATMDRFKNVKVLVPKELTTTELRHFLCGKVGCPFKELHIEIEGKPMWAGREMPLVEAEERDYRIKWRRVNRVAKLMQTKKIGGINALSREHGRTVLHFIALNGDTDLFREALMYPKADEDLINVRDKLGDTALTIAAITGYVDILSTCLEKEADVEAKNLKGRSALLLAAEHGHSDAVLELLRANANLDPGKGTTCPSAMYLAELNQRDGVVKTIVQYLEDMDGDDEF